MVIIRFGYKESTVREFPILNEIIGGRQGSSIDSRLSCGIVNYFSASIGLVIERPAMKSHA